MKKFVNLFDIHIGWDRKVTGGKVRTYPTHDEEFIEQIMNFIRDFKPDIVLLGGDQLDYNELSKYRAGEATHRIEGGIFKAHDTLAALVITPLMDEICGEHTEFVWLYGNHEVRLDRFLDKNPELVGALKHFPDEYRLAEDWNWTIVPQGGIYKLGKLNIIHGDTISGGTKDCAKRAASKYMRNLRLGHFHTYQATTLYDVVDSRQSKTVVAVPCVAKRKPSYMKDSPNTWVQGFNYGYVKPDGSFNDYVVIRVNGKFIAEGKEY